MLNVRSKNKKGVTFSTLRKEVIRLLARKYFKSVFVNCIKCEYYKNYEIIRQDSVKIVYITDNEYFFFNGTT